MADLAALRARVDAAESELYRIAQADDYAYTNGAYRRAEQVFAQAVRELKEAEGKDDHTSRDAAAGKAAI